MKILSFSLDGSLANPESEAAGRTRDYGSLVEKYTVLITGQAADDIALSEKANIKIVKSPGLPLFLARLAVLFSLYNAGDWLLKHEHYDVITVQDPFETAFVGWLLARRHKTALNIQEHGDFFSAAFWRQENLINYCRFYLGRFLIRKADSIRAVSERIKNTLVKEYFIDREKIVSVPIFMDIDKKNEPLRYYSLKEKYRGKFIFLTMGRFEKQKNLPLLIKAYKQITDNCSNTLLAIVGKGSQKTWLVNLTRGLGISDKVEFIDWTDDKDIWYESADAYVLSSNYEGWGRVIVEAASYSLPIVMTDVGCAGELIKDGESGLVVPIGDEKLLAQAMGKVYEDAELRKKIGEGARLAALTLPSKEETLILYKKSWELAVNYSNNFKE